MAQLILVQRMDILQRPARILGVGPIAPRILSLHQPGCLVGCPAVDAKQDALRRVVAPADHRVEKHELAGPESRGVVGQRHDPSDGPPADGLRWVERVFQRAGVEGRGVGEDRRAEDLNDRAAREKGGCRLGLHYQGRAER
ncbi:hypothetical protein CLCR_01344 [Cladophialophora carrionii]|uniref:Uncharacterized protein n=1 Tax=Cladophialophora carrionii TaxID=86049 RepID=A0A1C1CCN7_9EURO|nr:hypothetical protein CLCR_01344 [Cladophialophora carrionii]